MSVPKQEVMPDAAHILSKLRFVAHVIHLFVGTSAQQLAVSLAG